MFIINSHTFLAILQLVIAKLELRHFDYFNKEVENFLKIEFPFFPFFFYFGMYVFYLFHCFIVCIYLFHWNVCILFHCILFVSLFDRIIFALIKIVIIILIYVYIYVCVTFSAFCMDYLYNFHINPIR